MALVSQIVGLTGLLLVVAVRGGADLAALAPGAVAGAVGAGSLFCFYRALAIGTMSVVAPITATGAIVPVIVGTAQGERPSALQWVGIVAAMAGVVLASREPSHGAVRRSWLAIGLALAAAALIGFQLIALEQAADSDPLVGLIAARAVTGVVFAVAAVAVRPAWDRASLPFLAAIGVIDTAANAFFAYSTTGGYLSVVAVVGSLYPVVTVALAHQRLHERLAGAQRAGVVLALGGVLALAGG